MCSFNLILGDVNWRQTKERNLLSAWVLEENALDQATLRPIGVVAVD